MHHNRTLLSLFPEFTSYEDKIVAFLRVFYANKTSLRATGKELNISPNTVKAILCDVENTPEYEQFTKTVSKQILEFADPEFRKTIFSRYESQLQELETLAKKAKGSEETPLKLKDILSLKIALLRDMLKASLFFADIAPNKTQNVNRHKAIYDEALEEFGNGLN